MSGRMSDERLKQLDAAWSDEVRACALGAVGHTLDRRSGGLAQSPWGVRVRSLAHARSRLIRDQSVECHSDGVRRVMVDTLGVLKRSKKQPLLMRMWFTRKCWNQ